MRKSIWLYLMITVVFVAVCDHGHRAFIEPSAVNIAMLAVYLFGLAGGIFTLWDARR
jgi:hypothetical protein